MSKRVLEIARAHKGFVFPALGLHPWDLGKQIDEALEFIERNIDACVALGEVGLDFRIKRDRELQIRAFRGVLELAKRYRKPLIVHSRAAWREAFKFIRGFGIERALFHWYSGPREVLRELLRVGHFVSATPAAAYSEPHRAVLRETPLERLLLETDSPVVYRGSEAKPSDVVKTLMALAQLKRISEEELARVTTENANDLFGLGL